MSAPEVFCGRAAENFDSELISNAVPMSSDDSNVEAGRSLLLLQITGKLQNLTTSELREVLDTMENRRISNDASEGDEEEPVTAEETSALLENLNIHTWVRLAPSKVCGGCGVFAIRDIPKGTDPFVVCNKHRNGSQNFAVISESALNALDPSVSNYVKDFMAASTTDDDWLPQRDLLGFPLYGVNLTGMNTLDISWFLNHSDDPNMEFEEPVCNSEFNSYAAKRDIVAGEELLTDYRNLGMVFYERLTKNPEP